MLGSRFHCFRCLEVTLTVAVRKSEEHKCFLQNSFILLVNGTAVPRLYSQRARYHRLTVGKSIVQALEIKL